jgi:hypothetical protein
MISLKGKRTYLVALVLAAGSVYIWYKLQDNSALTGLITSFSMVGMRKISPKTIISECEHVLKFEGVNTMGINFGKAIQDGVLLVTDALAFEQLLVGNADLLAKFQRIKDDAMALVGDLETTTTSK